VIARKQLKRGILASGYSPVLSLDTVNLLQSGSEASDEEPGESLVATLTEYVPRVCVFVRLLHVLSCLRRVRCRCLMLNRFPSCRVSCGVNL
jgi:hypothetical protein